MILPYILTPEAKVPAADRLRAMFNDDKVRIVPELADCMGAKAAEMNGFEVIMVSSGDLACAMTGIPDLQLLSIDDFVRVTEQITHMTPMPLIIDADDGHVLYIVVQALHPIATNKTGSTCDQYRFSF